MRLSIPVIRNITRNFKYIGTCVDTTYFEDEMASAIMIKNSAMVNPSILQYCKLDVIPSRVAKILHFKYEEDYTLGISEDCIILFLYDIRKNLHYFWLADKPINVIGHIDRTNMVDRGVDKYLDHGEH